jgi:hypothetical protein
MPAIGIAAPQSPLEGEVVPRRQRSKILGKIPASRGGPPESSDGGLVRFAPAGKRQQGETAGATITSRSIWSRDLRGVRGAGLDESAKQDLAGGVVVRSVGQQAAHPRRGRGREALGRPQNDIDHRHPSIGGAGVDHRDEDVGRHLAVGEVEEPADGREMAEPDRFDRLRRTVLGGGDEHRPHRLLQVVLAGEG